MGSSVSILEFGLGAALSAAALWAAQPAPAAKAVGEPAPDQHRAPVSNTDTSSADTFSADSADTTTTSLGARYDTDASLPERAEDVASYELSAVLDPVLHSVSGSGTIVFHNRSNAPATELYFHLYLNAFKDDRSLFLRSPFKRGRSGLGSDSRGSIQLQALSAPDLGGVDLLPHVAPADTSDPEDTTDVVVRLPQAVAPGQQLKLRVKWLSQLPRIVERTGFVGDFHFVAQWFPKLAKHEPDGRWVHFPFHPHSEFYADYGTYDVELDVPLGVTVGATGARVQEEQRDGRSVLRYHAESVHDFAWTAWTAFQEQSARYGDTSVRVLYPPDYESVAQRTLRATEFGLRYFGDRYGRYPYPTLTVVIPPESAVNAGGMEYPTLITTGGNWYAPSADHKIELLTLHELAHQWFYGLVGTDEHAWPFLDEGLTSFAEAQAMDALFGNGSAVDLPGVQLSVEAFRRAVAAVYGHDNTVAMDAPAFMSFGEIGALAYARTVVILQSLAGAYGARELERALGRYARRYRFGHPGPGQLLEALEVSLGADAAETAQVAFFDRGWIDYAALDLRHAFAPDAPSSVAVKDQPEAGAPQRWLAQISITQRGTLKLPVTVELVDEDDQVHRRRLDGKQRSYALRHEGTAPLRSVQIDPDGELPLDSTLLNNGLSVVPTAGLRLQERLLYWTQLALIGLGP